MRFKRFMRHPFTDTPRKRAALRRKQQKERVALPLLASLIAEVQPGEDDVMAEQALSWAASEVRDRAYRAGRWRLATLSSNECAIFCGAWDCAPYPADPVYLLDFLHSYSVGRFTLDNLLFDLVPSEPHGCRL